MSRQEAWTPVDNFRFWRFLNSELPFWHALLGDLDVNAFEAFHNGKLYQIVDNNQMFLPLFDWMQTDDFVAHSLKITEPRIFSTI